MGSLGVGEGRERGAPFPEKSFPSLDPLRGPPSPASGGGKSVAPLPDKACTISARASAERSRTRRQPLAANALSSAATAAAAWAASQVVIQSTPASSARPRIGETGSGRPYVDVGRDLRGIEAGARDQNQRLRRQAGDGDPTRLDRTGKSRHVDRRRVQTGERARERQALRAAVVPHVAEADRVERRDEPRAGRLGHAAELKIRAGGDVDMAVAESPCGLRDGADLNACQHAERRVDAREQPVAGRHRLGQARAPAATMWGVGKDTAGRAHSAARGISSSAGIALRRLVQRLRARASSNRCRIARVAAGLAARRVSKVSASAIQAP